MTRPPHPGAPRLLDGGLATELARSGEPVAEPWWTNKPLMVGAKRERLKRIHGDFLTAGADVLTANTFRCNLRALDRLGFDPSAGMAWMVHAAVGAAEAAARDRPDAEVVGSIGPVEDCYRPDAVPSDDDRLRAEHRWLATELRRCGIRTFLVETMNTVREARIAVEEVVAVGGVPWVGFVCGDGAALLSGEPLAAAAEAVGEAGAELVCVNCTDVGRTETALRSLRASFSGAIGAYPNIEDRRPGTPPGEGPLPTAVTPAAFADTLTRWHGEFGLALLGGCCGTSPAHTAALGRALRGEPAAAARGAAG
ncbi:MULTISPECIES: homocysteine S-methyltransferase family protein [unclassified Nocardiopsis]|uniref:homocysteine S-methyltransferase family protein n=1 Tax=unclassified Nocardiopsis TaxID=2649073 RepID=UPI00135A34E6|nr:MULTISPECIES: homocysteine S-methyltransferase family protein [unclassified Nocardiopsis]